MDSDSEDKKLNSDDEYCVYTKKRSTSVKIIRLHKCLVCKEKFPNKTALEEHQLIHKIKPFKCPYCDYTGSLRDIMRNHIELQHRIKVKHDEISSYMQFEMVVREYKCKICDQQFARKEALHLHHQLNEACKPYICSHCDLKYGNLTDVTNKESRYCMVEVQSESEEDTDTRKGTVYKCEECDISLSNTRTRTVYKCRQCDMVVSSKSSLNRHHLSHDLLKRFACTYCQYRCALRGIMKNHMQIRHGISVKPSEIVPEKKDKMFIRAYKCTTCKKLLPSKESLEQHINSNNICKPFKCMLCDYRSVMRSTMRRHLQGKHGCTSDANDSYQDTRIEATLIVPNVIVIDNESNVEIKTGENKKTVYKCTHCDKSLSKKSSLNRHNLSHNGTKLFACTLCEYRCALKGIMKNHMQIRHGITINISEIVPEKRNRTFRTTTQVLTDNVVIDGSNVKIEVEENEITPDVSIKGEVCEESFEDNYRIPGVYIKEEDFEENSEENYSVYVNQDMSESNEISMLEAKYEVETEDCLGANSRTSITGWQMPEMQIRKPQEAPHRRGKKSKLRLSTKRAKKRRDGQGKFCKTQYKNIPDKTEVFLTIPFVESKETVDIKEEIPMDNSENENIIHRYINCASAMEFQNNSAYSYDNVKSLIDKNE